MAKLTRTTFGLSVLGESDTVTFDVTIRESHDWQYDVTTHEVERGSPIGDHVRRKPHELQFVVVTSATALEELDGKAASVEDGREFATIRQLRRMADNHEAVTLSCYLGRFEGYVISGINLPIGRTDGGSLSPTVTFTEYRQVDRVAVEVPEIYAAEVRRLAEQAADDAAAAATVQPEEIEEADNRSVLARIDDSRDGAVTDGAGSALEFFGAVSAGGGTAP